MCSAPNSKKQLRVRSITYVRFGATPMPAICDFGATLTQYLLRPVDAALPRTEDARASTQMARCGFSQTVAGTSKSSGVFLPVLKATRYGHVQRWRVNVGTVGEPALMRLRAGGENGIF